MALRAYGEDKNKDRAPCAERCTHGTHMSLRRVCPLNLGAQKGDQKRVMTPAEAVSAGADYLVIGRAITAQPDPLDAFYRIVEEIKTDT